LQDVRITTRYSEDNWIEGIAGTIHECGHAMYEQGRSRSQVVDGESGRERGRSKGVGVERGSATGRG